MRARDDRRGDAAGRGHGRGAGSLPRGGERITIPAGQKAGQNVRAAGEDLKAGVAVLHPGQPVRAAELGLIASLGIGEVR